VDRRRLIAGITVAVAVTVPSSASAGSIVGTAAAEVLRGTPKADVILGKAGDDRLYGLGGDDVLSGGPGADRFSCGSGRDVVNAQIGEVVARDCEVVRRAAARPPVTPAPPPPPPTPPAPTPPPPAPAPSALPGTYCGFTGQGPGICVTTSADGRAVTELTTSAIVDCMDGSRWTIGVRFTGRMLPLSSDLGFSFDYSGPLSSSGDSNFQAAYTIRGTFTPGGQASGTVAIGTVSFTHEGTRYSCAQNAVTWSTTRQ
jgi:hemolysin type calcium-binding protein